MSDIASCNYKARDKGVRNGMTIGNGLQQCPDLVIIPYEFEKYQSVLHTFYIRHSYPTYQKLKQSVVTKPILNLLTMLHVLQRLVRLSKK